MITSCTTSAWRAHTAATKPRRAICLSPAPTRRPPVAQPAQVADVGAGHRLVGGRGLGPQPLELAGRPGAAAPRGEQRSQRAIDRHLQPVPFLLGEGSRARPTDRALGHRPLPRSMTPICCGSGPRTVQSGPSQSARRLHMEMRTTPSPAPFGPAKPGPTRATPGFRTEVHETTSTPGAATTGSATQSANRGLGKVACDDRRILVPPWMANGRRRLQRTLAHVDRSGSRHARTEQSTEPEDVTRRHASDKIDLWTAGRKEQRR